MPEDDTKVLKRPDAKETSVDQYCVLHSLYLAAIDFPSKRVLDFSTILKFQCLFHKLPNQY